MKIILCGKNSAAVECLKFLVQSGDEVWTIGTAGDRGLDDWQPSLKTAAARLGVRFDQPSNINDPDFVKRLAGYGPSVLVSIQYDQILRQPLFDSIGCPCVNLHFALLPRHRGLATIAWAILSGDRETGVTMHHMTEAIDAGDVIAQRAVPIGPAETARQVYEKVSVATVELFHAYYPLSRGRLAKCTVQDHAAAVYHRDGAFDFTHTRVDWNRPAPQLHRWIRALIFPPFQYPDIAVNGSTLSVTAVDGPVAAGQPARPGIVVSVSRRALDVAAQGGVIRLIGLMDDQRPGTGFADLVQELRPGDRV